MQSKSDREVPILIGDRRCKIYRPLSVEDKLSDFVVYKENIYMKKTKILVPALGMLLLSTAASVTGTVEWFAANAQVTANGMAIKATKPIMIITATIITIISRTFPHIFRAFITFTALYFLLPVNDHIFSLKKLSSLSNGMTFFSPPSYRSV